MITRVRPFRHAASVILASNRRPSDQIGQNPSNLLSILTVKRKPSSSFMPSTVVFPGGAIDESDFHIDYATAYKDALFSSRDDDWLKHLSDFRTGFLPKPPAYDALRQSSASSALLPEWAFRICALRELFEECGILIGYCLNKRRYMAWDADNNVSSRDHSFWDSGRRRVHESAEQFRTFTIRELGVVPAFWLLDEWANWLAPSTYKQRSRFDTLFYVVCLDETPRAVVNVDELESGEWANPIEILNDGMKGKIILAPPQIYEMCRLANFTSVDQLRTFSEKRKSQGLVRFFPQLANSSDNRKLCILPGDDQYPSEMSEAASDVPALKFAETAAQLRLRCKNLHRAEFDFIDGQYTNAKIFISIPQPCGHVAPISI